jgi:hypothetical protein
MQVQPVSLQLQRARGSLPNFLARVRRHCASFRWKPPRLLHLAGADRRDLIRDGPGVPLARGWSWRAAAEARHY